MADKRDIHYRLRRLKQIKTWQLIVLLILVLFLAATFLRLNNVGMVERRKAVLAADQSGDKNVIMERLYDLQRYSSGHMNANTGPFYLEHLYKLDSDALIQAAGNSSNPNGNIYALADQVCKPRFSGQQWSVAYQECFMAEINKYPFGNDPATKVKMPDPNMYRHDFVSPIWSLDFAGVTVLIALGIVALILARLATLGALKLMLKKRYRDVSL